MRRRTFLLGSLAAAGLAACGGGSGGPLGGGGGDVRTYGDVDLRRRRPRSDAPNVLFISLDDCNDWLGFLNAHPGTHTPNLDALAAESLVFDHAYTAAPMCLPSRTAMLFGRPPHETGIYEHDDGSRAAYRDFAKRTASIVDAFWAAGYDTYGVGKVFHDEQKDRWTESFRQPWYIPISRRARKKADPDRFDPEWVSPYTGDTIGDGSDIEGVSRMVDFGPSGRSPEEDPDGVAVAWTLERLADDHDRPFFIGHGVYLPHEPWRVPQRFLDLHPIDEVVVPEVRPDDLDDLGPYARDEIIDRNGVFEKLRESGLWEEAVQAYQAAISYADWCVGQLLDALRSGRYADDTIVVISSDHGYHLGEKLHIHKFTLWERASRVPLVVHAPGRLDRPTRFDAPVSLVDIGPTMLDLCDVPPLEGHEGQSLLPALDDPGLADDRPPLTTWLEGNHAVRSGPWRYIRYHTGEQELYDIEADPNEFDNLAGERRQAALIDQLDRLLPEPAGN